MYVLRRAHTRGPCTLVPSTRPSTELLPRHGYPRACTGSKRIAVRPAARPIPDSNPSHTGCRWVFLPAGIRERALSSRGLESSTGRSACGVRAAEPRRPFHSSSGKGRHGARTPLRMAPGRSRGIRFGRRVGRTGAQPRLKGRPHRVTQLVTVSVMTSTFHECSGLGVAGATDEPDGGVRPGHRTAAAGETVVGFVRLGTEVVGLLPVQ